MTDIDEICQNMQLQSWAWRIKISSEQVSFDQSGRKSNNPEWIKVDFQNLKKLRSECPERPLCTLLNTALSDKLIASSDSRDFVLFWDEKCTHGMSKETSLISSSYRDLRGSTLNASLALVWSNFCSGIANHGRRISHKHFKSSAKVLLQHHRRCEFAMYLKAFLFASRSVFINQ